MKLLLFDNENKEIFWLEKWSIIFFISEDHQKSMFNPMFSLRIKTLNLLYNFLNRLRFSL